MARHRSGFASFAVDNLALGLLLREPRHGYQLYQEYQAQFSAIWQVGQSKFYAALDRLEERGLATSSTEDQSGRPARRVYAVTAPGRHQFLEWVYAPVMPIRAMRVEFVAKLRFFQLLKLDDVARLIEAQRNACAADLARTRAQREDADDPVDALAQRFREVQLEAYIAWLHECAVTLDAADAPHGA